MFASISLGLALLPFITAKTIDIQVGGAGGTLVYSPEAVSAQVGDQVVFHFNPKNHTVTQSAFANPCGLKEGGFDSGFMPVAANSTDAQPTYTIQVNDTQPIWVYCRQAGGTPASHCGQGMVFAVNCGLDGAANSFTNFKASALAIGASLSAAAAAPSSTSDGGYGGGYGGYGGDSSASNSAGSDAAATNTWTAAYGDYTIPPAPDATPITAAITLESSTWTTTYSSYAGSPEATPAALEGTVHQVVVGGPGLLTFDPPHVDAAPRDIIQFIFKQKNHTVTQSSFADPCRKLATGGFDSDFQPVADNSTDFPTWNITVNDTAPIWAYCRQKTPASHCGAGMVFAVNSVESSARNFSAFQSVAEALNGTSAASNTDPAATSTASGTAGSNGAISVRVGGAAASLFAAALVASFL